MTYSGTSRFYVLLKVTLLTIYYVYRSDSVIFFGHLNIFDYLGNMQYSKVCVFSFTNLLAATAPLPTNNFDFLRFSEDPQFQNVTGGPEIHHHSCPEGMPNVQESPQDHGDVLQWQVCGMLLM